MLDPGDNTAANAAPGHLGWRARGDALTDERAAGRPTDTAPTAAPERAAGRPSEDAPAAGPEPPAGRPTDDASTARPEHPTGRPTDDAPTAGRERPIERPERLGGRPGVGPIARRGPGARPTSGAGAGGFDDRDAERGLRGLVGSGSSQVSVGAAMRARDAARPTEADLAEAEERLVIVRRNWLPREDLPRNR